MKGPAEDDSPDLSLDSNCVRNARVRVAEAAAQPDRKNIVLNLSTTWPADRRIAGVTRARGKRDGQSDEADRGENQGGASSSRSQKMQYRLTPPIVGPVLKRPNGLLKYWLRPCNT